MNTYKSLILSIVALGCFVALRGYTSQKAEADSAPLAAGYAEQYTFRIAGKSIGTQSATLVSVNNGRQTWKFSIDLLVPVNTQKLSLKQDGTFVLDKDGFPLSLDTTAVTNTMSQKEKLTFGANGISTEMDPPIPAIANLIPVTGRPYLNISNLITLISLQTRANFAKQADGYVLPQFSGNALRQISFTVKPSTDQQVTGTGYKVFDGTLSGPGIGNVVNQYWLSTTTGEVIRLIDKGQNLEISKD